MINYYFCLIPPSKVSISNYVFINVFDSRPFDNPGVSGPCPQPSPVPQLVQRPVGGGMGGMG